MKKLILISALLFSFNGWAYSETDLAKFKALNACQGCDLSEADLSDGDFKRADLIDTNLSGVDLSSANLTGVDLRTSTVRNVKLDEAKFCKTQMPWGEVNDDCEE